MTGESNEEWLSRARGSILDAFSMASGATNFFGVGSGPATRYTNQAAVTVNVLGVEAKSRGIETIVYRDLIDDVIDQMGPDLPAPTWAYGWNPRHFIDSRKRRVAQTLSS